VAAKDGVVTTAKKITPQPPIPLDMVESSKQWLFGYTWKATPCVGLGASCTSTTVMNWLEDYAKDLPPGPFPTSVEIGELDELYTSIQGKKTDFTS
jgi:hypothetical protein